MAHVSLRCSWLQRYGRKGLGEGLLQCFFKPQILDSFAGIHDLVFPLLFSQTTDVVYQNQSLRISFEYVCVCVHIYIHIHAHIHIIPTDWHSFKFRLMISTLSFQDTI